MPIGSNSSFSEPVSMMCFRRQSCLNDLPDYRIRRTKPGKRASAPRRLTLGWNSRYTGSVVLIPTLKQETTTCRS